jgi:hypothetical protein
MSNDSLRVLTSTRWESWGTELVLNYKAYLAIAIFFLLLYVARKSQVQLLYALNPIQIILSPDSSKITKMSLGT